MLSRYASFNIYTLLALLLAIPLTLPVLPMHDFAKSFVGGIGGMGGGRKNQRGLCLKQEATVQPFCKPILRYTGLVLLSGPVREGNLREAVFGSCACYA